MADCFDVAKYILNKTKRLTTFKLQKLVYYSQAWSLVWDDTPLFKNKIYAWANGPVCKDLYKYHKGNFEISTYMFKRGDINNLSPSQKETINIVLKSYGNLSGQQLSALTHNETPWKVARGRLPIGERGDNEITWESMVEYYSALYSEQEKIEEEANQSIF